jgi:hypothetical protein
MSIMSCFAVLRLITRLELAGCITDCSEGSSPLRMYLTKHPLAAMCPVGWHRTKIAVHLPVSYHSLTWMAVIGPRWFVPHRARDLVSGLDSFVPRYLRKQRRNQSATKSDATAITPRRQPPDGYTVMVILAIRELPRPSLRATQHFGLMPNRDGAIHLALRLAGRWFRCRHAKGFHRDGRRIPQRRHCSEVATDRPWDRSR